MAKRKARTRGLQGNGYNPKIQNVKTPEEIKQIVTRLAGVAEVMELRAKSLAYFEPEEGEAFQRASKYVLDAADLIEELADRAAGKEVAKKCCERDHDGDGNCDRHPPGSVLFPTAPVAKWEPHFMQCELVRPTINGQIRCANTSTGFRVFPQNLAFNGMYGPKPLSLAVCDACSKLEIRWTVDGKAFGVD